MFPEWGGEKRGKLPVVTLQVLTATLEQPDLKETVDKGVLDLADTEDMVHVRLGWGGGFPPATFS